MKTTRLSRRVFLKGAVVAGAGLTMGFDLAGGRRALAQTEPFVPNAWIRITPDDIVTVIVGKSDMGQGVLTSMPMLIAEELEADWSKIRTEQAPAAPQVYGNPAIGGMQLTGGSTSVRSSWLTLRQAQEALKNGRLEEAHRLLCQPAANGHKRSWELLQQVAQGFVERGEAHLRHEDAAAAWNDLIAAEQVGVNGSAAGCLRQALTRLGLAEIRSLLEAGEPQRAADAITQLRDRSVSQPELQVLDEAAKNWVLAREQAGRGEFSQALQTMSRVRRLLPGRIEAGAWTSILCHAPGTIARSHAATRLA